MVDRELESQEGEKTDFQKPFSIELDDVYYSVKDRKKPILQKISFNLEPSSRILVTGESGSGKSTLLKLISGVIEPTQGNIYINNMSLNSIYLNHYRANLGLSLSDETPFEGTLRENLIFGGDKSLDQTIFEIAEIVGLLQFIKEQDNGLDTIIFPEGKQVSDSVAKKIILARAIIKEPKIMILEDPLDQFNDEETTRIIDYLTDTEKPWSLIVVSNKDSWRTKCSRTITLEKGEIKSII